MVDVKMKLIVDGIKAVALKAVPAAHSRARVPTVTLVCRHGEKIQHITVDVKMKLIVDGIKAVAPKAVPAAHSRARVPTVTLICRHGKKIQHITVDVKMKLGVGEGGGLVRWQCVGLA